MLNKLILKQKLNFHLNVKMNKMNKLNIFFILVLIANACQSNKKNEIIEIVSMDDLMGDSKDYKKDSTITDTIQNLTHNSKVSHLIFDLAQSFDSTTHNQPHPFDRYGFNSKEKITFIAKNNPKPAKIEFYTYNFSDSIKLNNAFYNWLDCFDDNCIVVKVKEDIQGLNSTPCNIFIYDTSFVYVKFIENITTKSQKTILSKINQQYGTKYRYNIEINKKGKLSWH